MLERIDICAEASPLGADEIVGSGRAAESSADIRLRVERVHAIQKARFADDSICYNSRMGIREIERYCQLDEDTNAFVKMVFASKQLSGRTYHKILKVARTIADMDESEDIRKKHVAEAIELRGIEDKLFGTAGSDD